MRNTFTIASAVATALGTLACTTASAVDLSTVTNRAYISGATATDVALTTLLIQTPARPRAARS
jgi:hypothetical protein